MVADEAAQCSREKSSADTATRRHSVSGDTATAMSWRQRRRGVDGSAARGRDGDRMLANSECNGPAIQRLPLGDEHTNQRVARTGWNSTCKGALPPACAPRLVPAQLVALREPRRHGEKLVARSSRISRNHLRHRRLRWLSILHRNLLFPLHCEANKVSHFEKCHSVSLCLREIISLISECPLLPSKRYPDVKFHNGRSHPRRGWYRSALGSSKLEDDNALCVS